MAVTDPKTHVLFVILYRLCGLKKVIV